MARILLVDDEPGILSVMTTLLKSEGYEVEPAPSGEKAKELLRETDFDLMISDIRMARTDGMQLLRFACETKPNLAVIMITGYGTVETAVEAMKLGAFDYITKPFKVDELLLTTQRALEYHDIKAENVDLKAQLEARYRFEQIVAESAAMRKVCDMIERVAPTDATVLISGESGTGKELVAQAIHQYSKRAKKRFVPINCAALPEQLLESELFGHVKGAFTGATTNKEGLFEVAQNGTIFLDEIGSLPLGLQSKLLRVLQEKQIRKVGGTAEIAVDARVLAASNESLETMMEEGRFREDLFYRLSVIPIEIAPLRERREDILPLAYHILRQEVGTSRPVPELAPELQLALERYPWPGNVRELFNAIRHALTFAGEGPLVRENLPARILEVVGDVQPGPNLAAAGGSHRGESLKAFLRGKEREYLSQVLASMGGDKEKAAKALKISLATLYRKLPED